MQFVFSKEEDLLTQQSDLAICIVLVNNMGVKEENKRMGKTRDLFKKIRDTKGTFHAKLGE